MEGMCRNGLAVLLLLVSSVSGVGAGSERGGDRPVFRVTQDAGGDFSGNTGEAIRAALDRVRQAGGGTVILAAGTFWLEKALDLSGLSNAALVGDPGSRLVLAPQVRARTVGAVEAGARQVRVRDPAGLSPGCRIEILAPGPTRVTPAGKEHAVPYMTASVRTVDGQMLTLERALGAPVPEGVDVIRVTNAVTLRGAGSNLLLSGLDIDLNRDAWPIPPRNHTVHCGVFVSGPYSYDKGPTAPPVERLRIVNCTIRNAHHRGIAWYSVVDSAVAGCTIENTGAEGIDFDHFSLRCHAVGNTLRRCRNLELNDASYCTVSGNTMEDCGEGIVVWQWCTQADLNVENVLSGNRLVRVGRYGVRLGEGADRNIVVQNSIVNPGKAAVRVAGKGNLVTGNRFVSCSGPGIEDTGAGTVTAGNERVNGGRPDGTP